MLELPSTLHTLQSQLLDAAQRFATDARPLSDLLAAMVNDVARAAAEPLEIFPVCHHSPSSALQLVQRLHQRPPKVIYIELCEDLLSVVESLADCKLPVALQAFAGETDAFPPEWLPLSVVAPLTESSAEYQAIAFTLQHPDTQLVFVDRAVDYVFQWEALSHQAEAESESELLPDAAKLHGRAVGIQVGELTPTFDQFLQFLLQNSNTRHFAEWWDQYVEQTVIGADYETYRQVMFLIGSLMRRLGRKNKDVEVDRLRERYMWTRMKQHLQQQGIAPQDAIHICGAAHTASDVPEFGTGNDLVWDIPPLTPTAWLYGLIPSSFVAIEYQFGHPPGTISLAETTWKKGLSAGKIKPFTLKKQSNSTATAEDKPAKKGKTKAKAAIAAPPAVVESSSDGTELLSFLTRPPALAMADQEQLLHWCAEIVGLARQNGYLSSTADSIAIYQTSMLLANLRNRVHPTPYDFQDAAITCLEKDRTPKKRNIQHLCRILLGGDRLGMVGYTSLPPLAQNVYDRLAPLNVNLQSNTNQRALMDFKQQPELRACSDVLWRLQYLLGDRIVQTIMGERSLGHQPIQESWEIRIGKHQRDLIMLGYEGVTLEQVLEQRLRQAAFDPQSHAAQALAAAEDSVLYLSSVRLTQELGEHATILLRQETGAGDAPSIFERVRRLVHYYRTTPQGLPDWIEQFVATGYSHYATLLPQAFADQGTTPEAIAGMLSFIFTLESLALALGCNRSQLLIGVQQTAQVAQDPAKLGLLWTTEWLLGQRSLEQLREFFDHVLSNEMLLPVFPDYLTGFILSLPFAPRISRFVVELLSKLFASVPDAVLLPWLPGLILRLRPHHQILQTLVKEAATTFPTSLAGFDRWQPAWLAPAKPQPTASTAVALSETEAQVRRLLFEERSTTNALAQILGAKSLTWQENISATSTPTVTEQPSETEQQIQTLLQAHPATLEAIASRL